MPLDHSTLVTLGSTLPPSLQVFTQLEQRMHDPFVEVSELVSVIRTDPSLVFKLLRLANSVMFGQRAPCDSLDEAVARVGIREIQRLVGLASSHQSYQHDLPACGLTASQVWENALATAVAAEVLARVAGRPSETGYSAGLMRNLGRVILEKLRAGSRYPGEATVSDVAVWERATYGSSSADAGADLLAHWRLSAELVAMIRYHADPLAMPEPSVDDVLLNLAGHIANRLGSGLPGEAGYWTVTAPKLALAGLDETQLAEAEEESRQRLTQVRSAFASLRDAA